MAEAREAGKFTLPDVASLIPGGLPVLGDDDAHTNAAAGSSSKNAAAKTALALIGTSLTFLFIFIHRLLIIRRNIELFFSQIQENIYLASSKEIPNSKKSIYDSSAN